MSESICGAQKMGESFCDDLVIAKYIGSDEKICEFMSGSVRMVEIVYLEYFQDDWIDCIYRVVCKYVEELITKKWAMDVTSSPCWTWLHYI